MAAGGLAISPVAELVMMAAAAAVAENVLVCESAEKIESSAQDDYGSSRHIPLFACVNRTFASSRFLDRMVNEPKTTHLGRCEKRVIALGPTAFRRQFSLLFP